MSASGMILIIVYLLFVVSVECCGIVAYGV